MIGANLGPLFDRPHIDTGTLCNPEEKSVAAILNGCVGAAEAMTVPNVARACGLNPRRCQSIVRHLIVDHGAPVCTSMRSPYGWYLAETQEEIAGVVELHRSRALAELQTMARLKGIGLRRLLAQIQTELEVA